MVSTIGTEMENEEKFALSWIGCEVVSLASRLSTINGAFLSKKRRKETGKSVANENQREPTANEFLEDEHLERVLEMSRQDIHVAPGSSSGTQAQVHNQSNIIGISPVFADAEFNLFDVSVQNFVEINNTLLDTPMQHESQNPTNEVNFSHHLTSGHDDSVNLEDLAPERARLGDEQDQSQLFGGHFAQQEEARDVLLSQFQARQESVMQDDRLKQLEAIVLNLVEKLEELVKGVDSHVTMAVNSQMEKINQSLKENQNSQQEIINTHQAMERQVGGLNSNIKNLLNEFFLQVSKTVCDDRKLYETIAVNQSQGILKVVHQHENQIKDMHNAVDTVTTKVDLLSSSQDTMAGNISSLRSSVAELIDYAKKGEERFSHLEQSVETILAILSQKAAGGSSSDFVPQKRSKSSGIAMERSRSVPRSASTKRGLAYWFGEDAGSPGGSSSANVRSFRDIIYAGGNPEKIRWFNKFSTYIEGIRDNRVQAPVMLDHNSTDLPKGVKKSNPCDKNIWIFEENCRRIKDFSRINMALALRDYMEINDVELEDGKNIEECIIWYEEGILPGDNITEALNYYIIGQVCDDFKVGKNFAEIKKNVDQYLKDKRIL